MKKVLYFDVETTGLDPQIHDIHQLSYIIEVDGKIESTANYLIKPLTPHTVEKKALEICKVPLDTIINYPPAQTIKSIIDNDFARFIDKYDSNDKFIPVAYNGNFDVNFLSAFYEKLEDNFIGSYIKRNSLIDPLAIIRLLDFIRPLGIENFKLSTVCDRFNISINAHDALSDITATRELLIYLLKGTNFEFGFSNGIDNEPKLQALLSATRNSRK